MFNDRNRAETKHSEGGHLVLIVHQLLYLEGLAGTSRAETRVTGIVGAFRRVRTVPICQTMWKHFNVLAIGMAGSALEEIYQNAPVTSTLGKDMTVAWTALLLQQNFVGGRPFAYLMKVATPDLLEQLKKERGRNSICRQLEIKYRRCRNAAWVLLTKAKREKASRITLTGLESWKIWKVCLF